MSINWVTSLRNNTLVVSAKSVISFYVLYCAIAIGRACDGHLKQQMLQRLKHGGLSIKRMEIDFKAIPSRIVS